MFSNFKTAYGLCVAILFMFNVQATLNSAITNEKITRNIDLVSQLVKVETNIVLSDVADSDSHYIFAVEEDYSDQMAFISATSKPGEDAFPIKPVQMPGKSGKFFEIQIKNGNKRPVSEFIVTALFTHKLVPFPTEIIQSEKQFIKFAGNAGFYSPYKTKSVETVLQLASSNILEFTDSVKPNNKQDKTIKYGPFTDVPAFNTKPVDVHYENNNPFLTIVDMTRIIEVSHWGNIAVEEHLSMVHSGAKLKGSFSRYDYQRSQDGLSSVKSFKTVLPAAAKDVYYRDEIGNISTSNMKDLSDSVELELRPRFPLFGGWQARYVLGYNVPSYEYLFNKGSHFGLKMRFIDHIYDDMVVDRITVKVILPEGVTNIDYKFPYPVLVGPQENMKTYLDTYGRTVLVLSKANLVENHIQDFVVYYQFSTLSMIREPLMVTVFFYILCMTVIVAVRLDFSIAKDEHSEAKMRVRAILDSTITIQDKRSALYQTYEDAINKYKQHKDFSKLTSETTHIEGNHRTLTKQITEQVQKLKSEASPPQEVVDKILDLQQQDTKLHEFTLQSIQQAERLVTGKIKREQYIESEAKIKEKRRDIISRMDSLIESV